MITLDHYFKCPSKIQIGSFLDNYLTVIVLMNRERIAKWTPVTREALVRVQVLDWESVSKRKPY